MCPESRFRHSVGPATDKKREKFRRAWRCKRDRRGVVPGLITQLGRRANGGRVATIYLRHRAQCRLETRPAGMWAWRAVAPMM